MMISPEYYYEEFLQGKNEKEILAVIRRLKRRSGSLKMISLSSFYMPIMNARLDEL